MKLLALHTLRPATSALDFSTRAEGSGRVRAAVGFHDAAGELDHVEEWFFEVDGGPATRCYTFLAVGWPSVTFHLDTVRGEVKLWQTALHEYPPDGPPSGI